MNPNVQLLSFLFFSLTTDKSFAIININKNNINKRPLAVLLFARSRTKGLLLLMALRVGNLPLTPAHSLSLLVTQIFITVDPDIPRKRARKEKRKEDVLLLLFFSCQKRRRRRRRRWEREGGREGGGGGDDNQSRSLAFQWLRCSSGYAPRATVLYCTVLHSGSSAGTHTRTPPEMIKTVRI